MVILARLGRPGTDAALGTPHLDDIGNGGAGREAPVEAVAAEIGEAAAGIDVVLKGIQCVGRVIFRVRPGHDRAIRLKQRNTFTVEIVIRDHVNGDALRRQPVDQMGVGREMPQPRTADLSRSLVPLDQDSTIIAVVELSQSSWLVGGVLPGIERQPRKKLEPSPERLLALLHRWRDESVRAGRTITRIAVAFEAGRDGFWLARWLEARGVEAHVIHPSSVAVSREHRRAKTDRLDTELLKRGFLGWLRGERGHCSMARVPTIAEEDAKRPNRERDCLVGERTRLVNRMKGTLARLGIRNFRLTLRASDACSTSMPTAKRSPLSWPISRRPNAC